MDLGDIQSGGGGALGSVARAGLRVLSVAWAAAYGLKRLAYGSGLRRSTRLPVPVLCVGNLTAGGTGKTPFTAWLVGRLRDSGRRAGILARGYGPIAAPGSDGPLNDEGVVLAQRLGSDVPQVQAADRVAAGRRLLARHPAIDVLVLDDGFQHWRLARDLDIVLLDACEPFGHGRLLPSGLLREPKAALARAGAVVLTRTEDADPRALVTLEAELLRVTSAPVAHARTRPVTLELDGVTREAHALANRAVFACCGIARPDAFAATLRGLGARLVGVRAFPDHRGPSAAAWPGLLAEARAAGADLVAITRKDAVKLPRLPEGVGVLDVETEIVRGEEALWAAVEAAIASAGA